MYYMYLHEAQQWLYLLQVQPLLSPAAMMNLPDTSKYLAVMLELNYVEGNVLIIVICFLISNFYR